MSTESFPAEYHIVSPVLSILTLVALMVWLIDALLGDVMVRTQLEACSFELTHSHTDTHQTIANSQLSAVEHTALVSGVLCTT